MLKSTVDQTFLQQPSIIHAMTGSPGIIHGNEILCQNQPWFEVTLCWQNI